LAIAQVALFAIGLAFFGLRVGPGTVLAVPALLIALIGMAGVGFFSPAP